jgi:hypothetical protein
VKLHINIPFCRIIDIIGGAQGYVKARCQEQRLQLTTSMSSQLNLWIEVSVTLECKDQRERGPTKMTSERRVLKAGKNEIQTIQIQSTFCEMSRSNASY